MKRGRPHITERQREEALLADPIAQVLLDDPDYARRFFTARREHEAAQGVPCLYGPPQDQRSES